MLDRGESERGAALLREAVEDADGWRRLLETMGEEMSGSAAEARRLLGIQAAG